jgi:hypothetical protein
VEPIEIHCPKPTEAQKLAMVAMLVSLQIDMNLAAARAYSDGNETKARGFHFCAGVTKALIERVERSTGGFAFMIKPPQTGDLS